MDQAVGRYVKWPVDRSVGRIRTNGRARGNAASVCTWLGRARSRLLGDDGEPLTTEDGSRLTLDEPAPTPQGWPG